MVDVFLSEFPSPGDRTNCQAARNPWSVDALLNLRWSGAGRHDAGDIKGIQVEDVAPSYIIIKLMHLYVFIP
jgi:hypothetical protein